MQQNDDLRDDKFVDLGSVIEETKGSENNFLDIDGGQRKQLGLSAD